MVYVDANVILRYLLGDITEQSKKAREIIRNKDIYILNEVLAEVVYVLSGVYQVERDELGNILSEFIRQENVKMQNKPVALAALKLFTEKTIDFVDTMLYGYRRIENVEIFTFDKKLKEMLE